MCFQLRALLLVVLNEVPAQLGACTCYGIFIKHNKRGKTYGLVSLPLLLYAAGVHVCASNTRYK